MFPGTYVPRYLCSPVPMLPGTYVPRTYVPRYLCSPVPMFPEPMFPSTYMFPGTYVPRFAVNDSSTPPRLIFLSLQIYMTSRCVYSLTRVDLDCDYLHTLYILYWKYGMCVIHRSRLPSTQLHSNGRRSQVGQWRGCCIMDGMTHSHVDSLNLTI